MGETPTELKGGVTRRVRRPKDKEKLLSRLIDEKVFETYRDTLAFAAALGYARKKRKAFDQTAEPIPWSVFSGGGYEALVNMVAVEDGQDFDILSQLRFEERLLSFEEYANGGLEILEELLMRADRQALDIVLDLIMDAEGTKSPSAEIEIEKFARDLSW